MTAAILSQVINVARPANRAASVRALQPEDFKERLQIPGRLPACGHARQISSWWQLRGYSDCADLSIAV